MPWLDNVPPTAPSELKVTDINNGYTELKWQAATDNDSRNNPMYVIYASNEFPVDTNRPENIVAQAFGRQVISMLLSYPGMLRNISQLRLLTVAETKVRRYRSKINMPILV